MPTLAPDHPAFHSIAERVARWDLAMETRYLAIERVCRAAGYAHEDEPGWDWRSGSREWDWRPQPSDDYHLVGGDAHPTLFKTLRNASRSVGGGIGKRNDKISYRSKPPGVIFPLLISLLPAVGSDEVFEGADLDELQYAERQTQLWANRTVEIRSKQTLASGK